MIIKRKLFAVNPFAILNTVTTGMELKQGIDNNKELKSSAAAQKIDLSNQLKNTQIQGQQKIAATKAAAAARVNNINNIARTIK